MNTTPLRLALLLKSAANSVGAIINPSDSVAINGNGELASSLDTTNPWANFSE